MRRYPLLPIAAAFAAGIAAAPYFYLTAAEQIGLLTAVVLGTAILLWKNRLGAVAITASVGLFLCGTFFAAADHHDAPPGSLPVLAAAGAVQPDQPLEIIGWARTPTKRRPGNESFDLEVEQIRQAGNWLPARGGIRVYYFPNADGPPSLSVAYGTRLLVSLSELRRPRNFLTPGSFDWEAYLRRQGIDFTARVRRPADLRALSGRRGNGWRAAIFDLRGRLLARIDQLYAEPKGGLSDHGAILKAMLLGDDDWLRPPVESAFQASGTYHILVVSGWNVFALAIPLLWLANRWRFPEWLTAGAVAAAVIGFALLAEGGAPVARAALMFLIYLLARFLYRDRAGLNSIAAAALLLLAMRPSDLRDPGFQLSFFAVLVLAAIAVPLVQWVATPYRQALRRPDDRNRDFLLRPRQQQFRNDVRVLLDYLFGRRKPAGRGRQELRTAFSWCVYGLFWVAEGLLFTAVVQMGLSLAMALHFHRLAWSGVFANLLVLPVASGMVMIGLPLLLLSLLWPAAAPLGAGVLGAIAAVLHWMVQTAASWDIL
ncbi:MAG TPA: ComEC family competence protein, partial [Terriglobia bacterium]|nr:ComEC family competence protein [Terriglobia bacterium]